MKLKLPRICIDTREQHAWIFPGRETVRVALAEGDYCLEGFANLITIERKALGDLVACCGGERDRFEHELFRLAENVVFPYVLIEGDLRDVEARNWIGMLEPSQLIRSIHRWHLTFGVTFEWCSTARHANANALHLFSLIEKDLRRLRPARRRGGKALSTVELGKDSVPPQGSVALPSEH